MKLHYRIGWTCLLALVRLVWGFRFRGSDRIPETGPVIIASNHISNWDPILLGLGCRREVHFIAKRELFGNPLLRWLLTRYNAIPVRRGVVDSKALRDAMAVLERGEVLLMFPGGRRDGSGDVRNPKAGVGFLAAGGAAKVVPAYITGSDRMRDALIRTRRLEVLFGDPMTAGEGRTSDDRAVFTELVAERISELRMEVERA